MFSFHSTRVAAGAAPVSSDSLSTSGSGSKSKHFKVIYICSYEDCDRVQDGVGWVTLLR